MTARQYEREGRLSRFSLDRRVTVLVLLLTTLVVGAAATSRIPVELIPSGFDDPFLSVRIPWADAPSKEVLDKITLPLEEELSTVRGIRNMFTLSRTGMSMAFLPFKHGTDMDVAYREVRDRVERAKARFPDDVDRVFVNKDDASGIPVFVLGVAIDEAVVDQYNLVQNTIVLPLERIDGVASVDVQGMLEKEVLIELDREKTNAAGLNIWELSQSLGSDNFTMASGHVVEGPKKLNLRSVAKYADLEELENRIVAPSIRLKDIATISYEEPEKNFRVRAMSMPAVAVQVLKEGDANPREASRKIDAAVEEMKKDPRLANVEIITLMSQGEIIDEALATLLNSGMIGGLIAGSVLLFFLRRFRLTLILALAIPLSLLIGLTSMYFAGETLNLITLLGLMVCVGLLVDNSVVVAENIHRLHREGMDKREACIHGAGEVALAITMSTLTTIIVFAPIALVDGPGQFFLIRLALPVCVSVAASLVVALVFIPLCVFLTLTDDKPVERPNLAARTKSRFVAALRAAYESSFGLLNRVYGRMLGYFLNGRRFDLLLACLGVIALTIAIPGQKVSQVGQQEEERAGFGFEIDLPASTTLEETEEWFLQAEALIESKQEELGLDGWFHFHDKNSGELQGWFARPRKKDVSPSEAARIVKEALPEKPGMTVRVFGQQEGTDTGADKSTHVVLVRGEDPDQLQEIKKDLEALFVKVPGVLGVKGRNESAPNELGLVVDRERAQQLGVNPQIVAGVVGLALRGTALPKFNYDGKEIPVRIRFQERDRESLTELSDFQVPTAEGGFVSVATLTDAQYIDPPGTIVRRDKRMARTITLELEEGKEEETRATLDRLTAGIDLPEGVSFGGDVQGLSLNEDIAGMKFAGFLSVVLIFLLMGFLFESFILPFSIITTTLMALVGVWWGHFLAGKDQDMLGFVAIVVLIGVVVNNGIVLIDYVNRLRNTGHSRRDAVMLATERRFRPIMMTAITTVGGMVPLALAGSNSIGLSYTSFAITLIGGMTTATLLTLLVVPVLYTLFDDLRLAFGAALGRAMQRLTRAEPARETVTESGPAGPAG